MIAAYRGDQALLAKQLLSLDRLSGGRLVVGVAAGGRADDFDGNGMPYGGRGQRLDKLLEELRRLWAGKADGLVPGPRPANGGPQLIIGGHSGPALRRAATFGDGWIAGGSSGAGYRALAERARAAWRATRRDCEPRMLAIAYVALGPAARDPAARYLSDYYAFIGAKAEMALRSVVTDADQLRALAADYEAAGCDELLLFPCVPDLGQLDLIANALPGRSR